MTEKRLRGVGIGAGYFSHYQYEAWNRIPEVQMTGIYNRTRAKAEAIGKQYNIRHVYDTIAEMLDHEQPDFVDIITNPETPREIVPAAAQRGIHIICQKPLALVRQVRSNC
jgi:predicted dehydrogenase